MCFGLVERLNLSYLLTYACVLTLLLNRPFPQQYRPQLVRQSLVIIQLLVIILPLKSTR